MHRHNLNILIAQIRTSYLPTIPLTLAVCRVPKMEHRSRNLVAFDNQPTCGLVVLNSFPKTILTHDTKGWTHIVHICVYGEKFTTLTSICTSCSVFGSDFYIEKN